MIRAKVNPSQPEAPDLTPLIDIVFIVIVFLLLTAHSQVLTLPVQVADTNEALEPANKDPKSVSLTLRALAPVWQLSDISAPGTGSKILGSYADWEALRLPLLALTEQDYSVRLIPETHAEVDQFVKALAFFHAQNVQNVEIIMEPSK